MSPITIVIPVYNRAHTIGRTLDSIDAQTVRPAHVVLVDNNSSDDSMAVIEVWASGRDYVTLLSEPLPGACAARNCGLRAVTTEWTMFFDSDDVMLPTHVADFTRAIENHPAADIIGRDIITRFIDGSTRRLYFHAGRDAMFHHIFRGCLSTQRFIARTPLFRKVGGWTQGLPGWDDYELGVRLLLNTPNIVAIGGNPSVITFQQEQSISGVDFSSHPERWEESLSLIRSHFKALPDTCRRKNSMLDWLDARAMILAAQYERESRTASHSDPTGTSYSRRAHELAERLYTEVIARTRHPRRQKLIYLHNLHFHRLTWLLARILL